MPGNYPIEALANSVLDVAESRKIMIDPMKLQKLMYLTHGYYLALTGEPMVDEDFEVWAYGPVAPSIYHEFKEYGSRTLPPGTRATYIDFSDLDSKQGFGEPRVPSEDHLAHRILDFVFDRYGSKSGIYLSDLTHKVGSPWHSAKAANPGRRNVPIPNDTILSYFKNLI